MSPVYDVHVCQVRTNQLLCNSDRLHQIQKSVKVTDVTQHHIDIQVM